MKNKRTVARERAQAETAVKITEALGADAFPGDAHAFLIGIYKDPAQPIDLRVHAAKAAIGYEKPRLAAVDTTHTGDGPTLAELIAMSYERKQAKEEDHQQQAPHDGGGRGAASATANR